MLDSNIEVVKKDMDNLVKDAQELFHAAALLTGEKADELRNRGMRMLDMAVDKAQQAQAAAVRTGKEMALTADDYVKENPWRAVAVAGGVGLVLGILLGRK
jgi:ElaB/YqjD/DUF883 family membrane-anchored ribosome-binding protein